MLNALNPPASPDQRAAVRFDTHIPVHVGTATGLAQNISNSGICFETAGRQEVGALVNLIVEYTLFGRRQHLACEGKVVRVEQRDGRSCVAARLLAPFFDEETVTV